jgi:hypothetical protein
MAIGDGIRRNVATISQQERDRLRDAILRLDTTEFYPDGVSKWDKQDEIHQATHVHGGPAFLSWHRELCNRFEALLREVDPDLSLHYWDWTTDPRNSTGTNLFTPQFMGSSSGNAGSPFQNFNITRFVSPGSPQVPSDQQIISSGDSAPRHEQFRQMRLFSGANSLEAVHGDIHGYIGGSIGGRHTAFEDPFVFLLHSNVERLWAMWQRSPGQEWRLDPNQVYGGEGNTTGLDGIMTNMEPWAGGSGLRPWAPPDNQQVVKNSKHPSVVAPPSYDTVVGGGWSDIKQVPGWFGWENQGGGIALADINGSGTQDLVVFHIDNANEDNSGYYRIGWNLDTSGNIPSF